MSKITWSFTENTRMFSGRKLTQIKYSNGVMGGWIETADNLDISGTSWLGEHAIVMGNACVYGNAKILDHAIISGNAVICGDAVVTGNAKVKDRARVGDTARVMDYAVVRDNAGVVGDCSIQNHAIVKGHVVVGGQTCLGGTACLDGKYSIADPIWIERGIWKYKPTVISLKQGLIYEVKPNVLNVFGTRIRLRNFNTEKKRRQRFTYLGKEASTVLKYIECLVQEIRERNLLNPIEVIIKSRSRDTIYRPDNSIRYVEPFEEDSMETPISDLNDILGVVMDNEIDIPRLREMVDQLSAIHRETPVCIAIDYPFQDNIRDIEVDDDNRNREMLNEEGGLL